MQPSPRPLRIAILTTARFHVCDLARELDALGHDVRLYSGVPRSRTRQFGLPDRCLRRGWEWLVLCYLLLRWGERFTLARHAGEFLLNLMLKVVAPRLLEPCDVFVGMSGMSSACASVARTRYGALIWIERGSRHILSQKEIIDRLRQRHPEVREVPQEVVNREVADYQLADIVAVPSLHAQASFIERGFSLTKIFRNPFGTDLTMFPATLAPQSDALTLLMVGRWSYEKGCDLLVEAWRQLDGVHMLHIGQVGDCPLPEDKNFEHVDPIPQAKLKDYYARAHVMVLASLQDGYGLVLVQALACGLNVVCSDRTGGEDLRAMLDDPSRVQVVPHGDPAALVQALRAAFVNLPMPTTLRDPLGATRQRLSWQAYGRRFDDKLREVLAERSAQKEHATQ